MTIARATATEEYCNESVCLFVCLSVSMSAGVSQKPQGGTSSNFLCMLSVAVAPSSGAVCDRLNTSGFAEIIYPEARYVNSSVATE